MRILELHFFALPFSDLLQWYRIPSHRNVRCPLTKFPIYASNGIQLQKQKQKPKRILSQNQLNYFRFFSFLRQFLLSEILTHNNPLSIHVIAHDYTNPPQIHAAAFYQRPQIKHDADLLVSTPYGLVESPALQNPLDLNDRYKRNTRMTN